MIGGVNLRDIKKETLTRFNKAFFQGMDSEVKLEDGGEYSFRIKGEQHNWSPQTVTDLQRAVRVNSEESYKSFSKSINDMESFSTIRGLLDISNSNKSKEYRVDSVKSIFLF